MKIVNGAARVHSQAQVELRVHGTTLRAVRTPIGESRSEERREACRVQAENVAELQLSGAGGVASKP